MKTSKLITSLQKLEKSVPFDADIVVEGDIYPQSVIGVRHNPPHTFLVLQGENDPYEEVDFSYLTDDEIKVIRMLRSVSVDDRRAVGAVLLDAFQKLPSQD
jgi:hypothetical protein